MRCIWQIFFLPQWSHCYSQDPEHFIALRRLFMSICSPPSHGSAFCHYGWVCVFQNFILLESCSAFSRARLSLGMKCLRSLLGRPSSLFIAELFYFRYLHGPHFIYPLTCHEHGDYFQFGATELSCCEHSCTVFCRHVVISLGLIPVNGMAGLYGSDFLFP